jgi:hypothetical protein
MPLYKVFILLFISNLCFAQTSVTRTASANVVVNSFMSFDINTNGFLEFKFNNNQQLLDGITLNNKFSVNVASNKNWTLNVSSLTSNFLAIGPDASMQMPPSILTIKKSNSTTYIPISNSPGMITLGYRGNKTASGNQFTMDIKATPGFDFNGGAYMIVLIFTMSPQ